jgi:hypothetical protein
MLIYLFGGYTRPGRWPDGTEVVMRFWTYRGACRYGTRGLSSIDPYAKFLGKRVVFIPGRLTRRAPRSLRRD